MTSLRSDNASSANDASNTKPVKKRGKRNLKHLTEDNVLTLKGERAESEVSQGRFRRVERRSGTFSRSFTLPNTADPSGITASYKDGVLTVRIPQREEAKPKQIAVE